MVNVRDKQVMSVARVSSMNGYYAWHPRPYIHSFLNKGIITVHNDYGEMALSPMTVVRDGIIEDDDVIEDVCFEPLSVNEKYEVLHSFDFYESNMPKSSKYELLLDKDGYLTRKQSLLFLDQDFPMARLTAFDTEKVPFLLKLS